MRLLLILVILSICPTFASANTTSMAETIIVCDDVIMTARVSAGGLSPLQRVNVINDRLNTIIGCEELSPCNFKLVTLSGERAIFIGKHLFITVTRADADANGTTVDNLAERWLRNAQATLPMARPSAKCDEIRQLP